MRRPLSTRPDLEPVEEQVRLDADESPIGPPPGAVEELVRAAPGVHRYPGELRREVTNQVARHCGVSFSSVVLTSGVEEAVELLVHDLDVVWTPWPGSDRYARRARLLGKAVATIPLSEAWTPRLAPRDIGPAGLVVLGQPNDPTGTLFDRAWIEALPAWSQRVCVDETALDRADGASFVGLVARHPNACVYRDLAAALGVAGVRLGALLAPPQLAARLRARQSREPVDTIALYTIAGALREPGYETRLRAGVREGRAVMLDLLVRSRLFTELRDTCGAYVLARCVDAPEAAALATLLAQRSVFVLDCAPLGLPGWLRVGAGSPWHRERLEAALADISPEADLEPRPALRPAPAAGASGVVR